MKIKTLSTERLKISKLRIIEIEKIRKLHNEPSTLKWLSDSKPVTPMKQLRWFWRLSKSKNQVRLVARAKINNEIIGIFRLDNIDLENAVAQVGLDIAKKYRGKGYGQEFFFKVMDYCFLHLAMNRLELITLKNNVVAVSLYKKLGFKEEGIKREYLKKNGNYQDVIIFSILRREFQK